MYTPPNKRRRTSLYQPPRNVTVPIDPNGANIIFFNTDPVPNSSKHILVINDPNGVFHVPHHNSTAFKTQLQEVLYLFPPLAQFISAQPNPNQLFEELYQVFSSSPPFSPMPPPSAPHKHPSTQLPSTINHNGVLNVPTPPKPRTPPKPPPPSKSNAYVPPLPPIHAQKYVARTRTRTPVHNLLVNRICPPANTDPGCIVMFNTAKQDMTLKVLHNMDLRCIKIVDSLNLTASLKCATLRKQFTMNTQLKKEIFEYLTHVVKSWDGGKPMRRAIVLTKPKAFKMVREYWNRQKAQELGDKLFSLVLQNIFVIVLQISEFEAKEQMLLYIDLVCGLLSNVIHFKRSKPR
eukprot:593609_1